MRGSLGKHGVEFFEPPRSIDDLGVLGLFEFIDGNSRIAVKVIALNSPIKQHPKNRPLTTREIRSSGNAASRAS